MSAAAGHPVPEPRACVIGWPVAHSRSPLIHNYWLRHYRLAGTYDRAAVPPEELDTFLRGLGANGYVGCNVTVPHKEAAFSLIARPDAIARRLKAVNTLWLEGGEIAGTNTDIYGFLASLDAQVAGWDAKPGAAVILGAGGAARAVAAALGERWPGPLYIVNRSPERARRLAADLQLDARIGGQEDLAGALAGAGLLVNTTSLGMVDQPALEFDLSPLPRAAAVRDIVYVPLETGLLAAARRRGHPVADGLGMLLHQAVPGFARWFGRSPEVTAGLRRYIAADIAAALAAAGEGR